MDTCPTVRFTDQSVSGDPIWNWAWTFGDGDSSTLQSPTHTYPANGVYNVCLSIFNVFCQGTNCELVTVECLPVGLEAAIADFEVQLNDHPASTDALSFTTTTREPGTLHCSLFALDGRLIGEWQLRHLAGKERHEIPCGVGRGVYWLRVADGDQEVRILRWVKI